MAIRVLFFATIAELAGKRETAVDPEGHRDVGSIFEHLLRECPPLQSRRNTILFAVNSEFARPDTPVRDGDEIAFFPPVSGG
jgi:molybdopterin converting factor subunit 1